MSENILHLVKHHIYKITCSSALIEDNLRGHHMRLVGIDAEAHPYVLVRHRHPSMWQFHVLRARLGSPRLAVFVEVSFRGIYQGQCALNTSCSVEQ